MTLQLAPVTDTDLSAVADFLIATALVRNLPLPSFSWPTRASADPQVIEGILVGPELKLYRDHAGTAAARRLVLTPRNGSCYIMFREATRMSLLILAAILYVSNVKFFTKKIVPLACYLLIHYQVVATLAELRILGRWSRPLFMLPASRSKMYKSTMPETPRIDDLYSELVCVPW